MKKTLVCVKTLRFYSTKKTLVCDCEDFEILFGEILVCVKTLRFCLAF